MTENSPRLCVLIHLDQDLDLLVPILIKAQQLAIPTQVLVYKKMAATSPRIIETLTALSVDFQILSLKKDFLKILKIVWKSTAVLTAVETPARAHTFGHTITKLANFFKKKTITLQHGLENIGLTYSSPDFPIAKVKIASKKILIWGKKETLHPDLPPKVRERCVEFGCTKDFRNFEKPKLKDKAPFTVVFFENLHWERYSKAYVKAYLQMLESSIQKFPDIQFIVKPHHAGRWLARRVPDFISKSQNVLLIDPKMKEWHHCTGPSFISISDVVITTPSTIALDAAMLEKPVAVFGHDLNLSFYSPLKILQSHEDAENFINDLQKNPFAYTKELKEFCNKHNCNPNCLDHLKEILQ